MTEPKSREWLLLNAVEAWLHNYQNTGNPDTVKQYEQLQSEFYDAYHATLNKDTEEPAPKPTPKRKPNAKTTTAKAV